MLVFGATKKTSNPYLAALIIGVIKGAIYLIFGQNIIDAFIMAALFAGFAAVFVYFMKRVDRPKKGQVEQAPSYDYQANEPSSFRWEYIPLVIVFFVLIGAEFLLSAIPVS